MRRTHRVTLELEVDDDPEQAEPEDWDLKELSQALRTGLAKPLRTIRGLVVDPEHDRLSNMLNAIADGIDETSQLHWMATAKPWPHLAAALRAARPSLESLVGLEWLARSTRQIAERLRQEGL
jgi:hypothetical protein